MIRIFLSAFFSFAVSSIAFAQPAKIADLPKGFKFSVVLEDFSDVPSTMAFSPDGRLFAATQDGQIYTVENGATSEEPILSLDVDSTGEHGLVGLVFDPGFAKNHFFYVYYTALAPEIHQRVSRFTLNNDHADDEKTLLEIDNAGRSIFHAAGALEFGPDGYLYVGVGDNGGLPARENSQSLKTLFGKILRIGSDGSIPQDNPFSATAQGQYRAIWATGFRNPYSFSFAPESNRFWINDVGAVSWEEINEGVIGHNYGWPSSEGPTQTAGIHAPVFSYAHGPTSSATEGCAIVGGVFYPPRTGSFPPEYRGKYFFTDYCNNWVRTIDPQTKQVSDFARHLKANPSVLRVGPDGALYYMSRWQHGIHRIQYEPNR